MSLTAMRTEWQRIFQQVNTGSATLTTTTAALSAVTPAAATVPVQGAAIGDIVDVSYPTNQPVGLFCFGVVTAANVVTIYFLNPTVGALTATAGVYKVATYPFTNEVV